MRARWVIVIVVLCLGMVIGAVLYPTLIGTATAGSSPTQIVTGRYIPLVRKVGSSEFLVVVDTQTGRTWKEAVARDAAGAETKGTLLVELERVNWPPK